MGGSAGGNCQSPTVTTPPGWRAGSAWYLAGGVAAGAGVAVAEGRTVGLFGVQAINPRSRRTPARRHISGEYGRGRSCLATPPPPTSSEGLAF